jgi:hypothetical protein
MRIPHPKKTKRTLLYLGGQRGVFPKKFRTLDMASEGLGEIFEGDSADTCTGKFPLMLMGGQVEGLACADPGTRTLTGVSGILVCLLIFC